MGLSVRRIIDAALMSVVSFKALRPYFARRNVSTNDGARAKWSDIVAHGTDDWLDGH
jgi:hypothetical protein